jgi:hypothetical protein
MNNSNAKAAEKNTRRSLFPLLPLRLAAAVLTGGVFALAATVAPLCAQDTLFGKRSGDGGASPAQTAPVPIVSNAPLTAASKEALTAAVAAPGCLWETRDDTYFFLRDGRGFSSWTGRRSRLVENKWRVTTSNSIVCEQSDGKTFSFVLSSDGAVFARNDRVAYRRKTLSATPLPAAADTVSPNMSGSHWTTGEAGWTLAYLPLGRLNQREGARVYDGAWKSLGGGFYEIEYDVGNGGMHIVSPDGKELWQCWGGGSRLWKRVGIPAAVTTAENKPAAGTVQPADLERDFANLWEAYEKALAAAFASAGQRNLRALDALKSKVRSAADMNILPFVEEAREKITRNETIGYASVIRSGEKAAPVPAKEFQRIVFAHEKALNDAARFTATRFASQFAAFLKRALQAGNLDLAQTIKNKTEQLDRDKSGAAGFWREQQGKKKIVHLQRDGRVWHEDEWCGGNWKPLESNSFKITKKGWGRSFWDNYQWNLRGNSTLQRGNDANRTLKRENPPF